MMRRAGLAALAWLAAVPASAGGSLPATFSERDAGAPLDLGGYRLKLDQTFDRPASLRGPRLFAPVHAPYGAGKFDPPDGRAYQVTHDASGKGVLRITAYKDAGGWRSGSVQTADAAQSKGGAEIGRTGFACRGCYFEARLRFPRGAPGYWSAFWLLSPDRKDKGHVEVDVVEWYGGDPTGHHQSVHVWRKGGGKPAFKSNYSGLRGVVDDGGWHDYGLLQEPGRLTFYVDRKEVSRVAVGDEFDVALYPVISLAVLPKEADRAKGPMVLDVAYLRAYAPR
jgi:hypothetical protein